MRAPTLRIHICETGGNVIMSGAIRFATPGDAAEILKIYAPYITDNSVSFETEIPTIEAFTERMENIINNYPYFVYEVDGRIAGYVYASKHRERAAYKYSVDVAVYIAPEYKRQGIGKILYNKLFELLKNKGIYTAYAGITLPNEASVRLHKSLGFTEVGTYKNVGYKLGKWRDVAWFEKLIREYDILPTA